MMVNKGGLPENISTARTIVRRAKPDDLVEIESWPGYPWPYQFFNMTRELARSSSNSLWWQQIDKPDRCHYSVVLPQSGEIIGVHALVQVDWMRGVVGNMGTRIRADVCDRGYGTESLRALLLAVLNAGILAVRLDVAAPNKRAIRCYEKSGMRTAEEFWREHRGDPIDPSDSKWSFAMPHLRRESGKWMVRFYWMEITAA